ncbi:hypothetical protein A2V56_01445 [Candidatus Woesebacteria bacterium RBG_19FT_COMBO_42_9]|uniref:Uncharacterized protein n=1 Tax=Candidatus Woesebacteria bacterium RBG_16_42_24 TaxID=1802485 RepID=A0A1F7XLX7_9BACT|nr:MAG: hypothetical protein A2V97_04665 [Candidatus Woesebacteria bacterium RBG_16_42_24]OGM17929.1 MAG: hypothetical protein A2V56_01445 [Candidatus Woesebacteria bacterium RBG_19FT_COMBO_42_9]OGM66591.1 MAG: hypothetical protein A2985_02820 [Candidatus Woesebacteria bacterium RIFCSPLOWO2_01_FULL_43_11]
MGPEQDPITKEEFSSLPDDFFLSIDKRIVSISRLISSNGSGSQNPGYHLIFDYGEKFYSLRVDYAHSNVIDGDVIVVWHQVASLSSESQDAGKQLVDWWEKEYPDSLFSMAARSEGQALIGLRIRKYLFKVVSPQNLISKLIDLIPKVEAKAKAISSKT